LTALADPPIIESAPKPTRQLEAATVVAAFSFSRVGNGDVEEVASGAGG